MTIRSLPHRDGIASGPVPPLPAGLEPRAFLSSFFELSRHTCAVVLDPACRILWNSWSTETGDSTEHGLDIGTAITEHIPGRWSQERTECVRAAIETGDVISLYSIWQGQRMVTRFRAIENDGETTVLCVCESTTRDAMMEALEADERGQIRVSQAISLGPLSVLTARELEVLSLIGEGLRSKDIAAKLSRSVSTVEGHRERIGQKLAVHDRAELLLIARRAGLRLEDAKGERIESKP